MGRTVIEPIKDIVLTHRRIMGERAKAYFLVRGCNHLGQNLTRAELVGLRDACTEILEEIDWANTMWAILRPPESILGGQPHLMLSENRGKPVEAFCQSDDVLNYSNEYRPAPVPADGLGDYDRESMCPVCLKIYLLQKRVQKLEYAAAGQPNPYGTEI